MRAVWSCCLVAMIVAPAGVDRHRLCARSIIGRPARDVPHGNDTLSAYWSSRSVFCACPQINAGRLARLVGFSLGITGAAMQGVAHPPREGPGITGVTSARRWWPSWCFYFRPWPAILPFGVAAGRDPWVSVLSHCCSTAWR